MMDKRTSVPDLANVLSELLAETDHGNMVPQDSCCHDHLESMDYWDQLSLLNQLLCKRMPVPKLSSKTTEAINTILQDRLAHRTLTSVLSVSPKYELIREDLSLSPPHLSLWKGDITTLTDVTAIVNAANSQMLGCFQPHHRCIDNAIHSVAGPELRQACFDLMAVQNMPEAEGLARVTKGFNLNAQYIVHTVGPQIKKRQTATQSDQETLASCYRSCLDSAEGLPPLPSGRKTLVFCCISTGVFSFPAELASSIAIETVLDWCMSRRSTTLTDICFNVFTAADLQLYQHHISRLQSERKLNRIDSLTRQIPRALTNSVTTYNASLFAAAVQHLKSADNLIITAGAGLSSAAGLDYTSSALFARHLPGFLKYGFRSLYEVFGYDEWPTPQAHWSYLVSHLNMVRTWPRSPIYARLLNWAHEKFGKDQYFVRTSNADGFFVKNGFPPERISTPQGQYAFLQCFDKCRPDACFLSEPFINKALPFLNHDTQHLPHDFEVPSCEYCGGDLVMCVRGGDYYNNQPYRSQNKKWKDFIESKRKLGGKTVILELGVGMNTPSVLRWANDHLVMEAQQNFKLVRLGLGAAGCVSPSLEGAGLAVGLEGNIEKLMDILLGGSSV